MTKRAVVITSSIIVGIMMIFTILFGVVFRVRKINVVYGNNFCYEAQVGDILSVSKLKKNTSIFDINRNKIIENIETNYPYARVDGVSLTGLTSVGIILSNRTPLYYFVENEVCYILDEDCKVLEILNIQEYNDKHYQYIEIKDVFSANQNVKVGQFLNSKYTSVCNDLYNALYSNAMIEVDNGNGEFEAKYLELEDMCDVINSINFNQVYELNGKVDKLTINTSYGVKISIIEPQKDLDGKINRAFSVFRMLQQMDRTNGEQNLQGGLINVAYSYDDKGNVSVICEYRV